MASQQNRGQGEYEVPAEMREMAEKSIEQAHRAVGGFLGAAQRTAESFEGAGSTVQSNVTDMTRKSFAYAEQNIGAAFELARRLVRAKDMQEAMQIQAEFARQQFAAMQNQMKEFGNAAQSAMAEAGAQAQKSTGQSTPKR